MIEQLSVRFVVTGATTSTGMPNMKCHTAKSSRSLLGPKCQLIPLPATMAVFATGPVRTGPMVPKLGLVLNSVL